MIIENTINCIDSSGLESVVIQPWNSWIFYMYCVIQMYLYGTQDWIMWTLASFVFPFISSLLVTDIPITEAYHI